MRRWDKGGLGCLVAALLLAFSGANFAGELSPPPVVGAASVLPPPEVEWVWREAGSQVRVFRIDFVTRNIAEGQTIGVFIRRANGDYWPVPEERLRPRVIPVNQKTSAAVEVVGVPRDESFSICLYALKRRGQELLREWFSREGVKEPFKSIAYGIELGSIRIQ